MIIIVEGIDRVGKTTLINKLVNELGIKNFKFDLSFMMLGDLENKSESTKLLNIAKLCKDFFVDVIFDRFHWSDFVYGVLERGYDYNDSLERLNAIDKELVGGAIIVLVNPTDVNESSRQHGKDLSEHQRLFTKIAKCTKLNIVECDYNSLDYAITEVKNIINGTV